MRDTLFRFYTSAQRRLVPGLQNSQAAYRKLLTACVNPNTTWLDLGCGHELFPQWLPSAEQDQAAIVARCKIVVGIDYDILSLQKHEAIPRKVRGNVERLPFRDGSFDLVTANVVVEHIEDPRALLQEVHRVLRPGGIFLFHTPNLFSYATLVADLIPGPIKLKLIQFLQNRKEEDVFPTFYRMNTLAKVRKLVQATGFRLAEFQYVESSAQMVMLGPLVVAELLWIRLLRLPRLQSLRTNIIAVLEREAARGHTGGSRTRRGLLMHSGTQTTEAVE